MPEISKPYRILVARFSHESNRLNPRPAEEDLFVVERGHDILQPPGGVLKGLTETLVRAGATLEPVFSASEGTGGLVDHDFNLRMREELLDAVRCIKPDAIGLELHGAMGTTEIPDAEGDLLQTLRHLVGLKVPIGVGLDLHGHITPRMLDSADICIACKENHHTNFVECGQKVAELLIEQLEGRLKPVTVSARVPIILPGAGETGSGPLDGDFIVEGPLGRGDRSAMGPTAVIRVDDRIDVMLTTNPVNTIDPAAFTSQHVVIGDLDFVLVKSGFHFVSNFAGLAAPVIVNTPALVTTDNIRSKFRKAHFWPEHDFASP